MADFCLWETAYMNSESTRLSSELIKLTFLVLRFGVLQILCCLCPLRVSSSSCECFYRFLRLFFFRITIPHKEIRQQGQLLLSDLSCLQPFEFHESTFYACVFCPDSEWTKPQLNGFLSRRPYT